MTDEATRGVFASLEGQRRLPRWFPMVFSVARRIETGALEFELPDGRVFRAEGSAPGAEGRIQVRDPRFFGGLLRGGELAFAEAYLEGWWTTPDLQSVLDAALDNNEAVARAIAAGSVARRLDRLRHWLNRNTRRQARRNIEAHYDLGNEFYGLWLDASMTYSSGLFERPDETLEQAQRNKYRAICDRIGLRQGDHVLEIGCGWGGFAEYAARERGLRVTGLTLSPAQLDFARARIQREGLGDRVELALRDYRDERGTYDGVVSIEMFEAVGEKFWPAYFSALRERLKPQAQASLQIITIADHLFERYRGGVDFIQKYVFPGGMLPSSQALQREIRRAGLEWVDATAFGPSYSETLRRWFGQFNDAWEKIEALGSKRLFDERFRRIWSFYLTSCAACFRAQTTDVMQIALKRA